MFKQRQKIMQKTPMSMKQKRTNIQNIKQKQSTNQTKKQQIKQCSALEQITNTLSKPIKMKFSQKNHNASNHSFQYYMSEVQRQLMRRKQKIHQQLDQQNIFINHVMYCLYIFKTNRYISPSQPTSTVHLNFKESVNQLGKNNLKNVVIFDLDETLIHSLSLYEEMGQEGKQKYYKEQIQISITENIKKNEKKVSSVDSQHQEGCTSQNFEEKIKTMNMSDKKQSRMVKYATKIKVNIRPYAKQVLKRLSQYFTIGIFTAAEQQYTNQILKFLDPTSNLISFRLYRQHCTPLSSCSESKPEYVKDLRIIQKIELNRVVLVDNSPISYLYQPDNGIPIIPFVAQSEDDQLLKLQSFLHRYLLTSEDVRPVVKKMFRSREYQKFNTVRQVVDKVGKFNQFLI